MYLVRNFVDELEAWVSVERGNFFIGKNSKKFINNKLEFKGRRERGEERKFMEIKVWLDVVEW